MGGSIGFGLEGLELLLLEADGLEEAVLMEGLVGFFVGFEGEDGRGWV